MTSLQARESIDEIRHSPKVIPDEALAPQVRPPVPEKDEGVEVRQELCALLRREV